MSMKQLLKQGIQFIGLSGIGWILDFSVYTIVGVWSKNLFFNNILSSWIGVTFVFIFSTLKKSDLPIPNIRFKFFQ